jgi:hypothetical protein
MSTRVLGVTISALILAYGAVGAIAQDRDGQTVTVTYRGGEIPASKDDIAPGAIVFVPTERQSDGSLHSGAVLFGKDGVIPPK